MKYYKFALFLLFFTISCGEAEIENENSDNFSTMQTGTLCHEEPPLETYWWPTPEHCQVYDDRRCCIWYTDEVNGRRCYDEWCVWDESCGWEFENNFCPLDMDEEVM